MQEFIRADRTGDGSLHIETLKKAIAVFHIMDRPNYSRWAPVYLYDVNNLKKISPESYDIFIKGGFAVKQREVPFTSISADQALEMTINKDTKSIAGTSHLIYMESIAAWEITHHEFVGTSDLLKNITFMNENHFGHHEDSKTYTSQSEEAVEKLLNILEAYKLILLHQNFNL